MPKTGSASIAASLKKTGFHNVFHVHKLDPNEKYPFSYSQKLTAFLTEKINNNNIKFKLITCVRDPIARNISDIFQILKVNQKFRENGLAFPSTFSSSHKFLKQGMNIKQIQDLFWNDYPYHDLPLFWLDENIKRNLGIDIFSREFPKDKGYLKISQDNIDLLIMKLELSDSLKEEQIAKFIENDNFKLIRTNITSQDKFSYSHLYNEFKKKIDIPLDYLEKMYSSKYVNHFYTDNEIELMRNYWLGAERI
ncbi:MAG: putative capsular polysaccharide synthesis family protein [Cyanobacteria bacterium J06621_15]